MQNDQRVHQAIKAAEKKLKDTDKTSLVGHTHDEMTLFTKLARLMQISFLPPESFDKTHLIYQFPSPSTLSGSSIPVCIDDKEYWVFSDYGIFSQLQEEASLVQPHLKFAITTPSKLYHLIDRLPHYRHFNLLNQPNYKPHSDTIISCVQHIMQLAALQQASDVHIEPFSAYVRIRNRINGLLTLATTLPIQLMNGIGSRIKILAELNITETRLPQDGRFQFVAPFDQYDCRVSFCPTQYGEKIVIRLLKKNIKIRTFTELGINRSQLPAIRSALSKPNGLILVTGPTGSGKTQTLYTLLQSLHHMHVNINTIEDPIEITVPGINQTQIKPNINLTFASVLKALLRQDPDIMMVGEIRDHETADIAIRAAQTGHLVLSTLHTNSAKHTISRLLNMGVPNYNLVDCINLIIAQRLIRLLCSNCKTLLTRDEHQYAVECHSALSIQDTLYKAGSCIQCEQGYTSRTALFEIAVSTEAINGIVAELSSKNHPIKKEPITLSTLYDDGMSKVKQGITTIQEIIRVTAKED